MKLVNRISLIVTPKQAMYQWLIDNQFEQVPTFEQLSAESSCYLLEEPTEEQSIDSLLTALISLHCATIWQSELGVWDEFSDNTPPLANHAMFTQWFDVRLSGLTFDLAKQPLLVAQVD